MKTFMLAAVALGALVASPAMARDNTHISFGFYSPAPVYYAPPHVVYRPVQYVRYEPPCADHYRDRHHRHGHGYGWGHERRFESAWNEPRYERGWRH